MAHEADGRAKRRLQAQFDQCLGADQQSAALSSPAHQLPTPLQDTSPGRIYKNRVPHRTGTPGTIYSSRGTIERRISPLLARTQESAGTRTRLQRELEQSPAKRTQGQMQDCKRLKAQFARLVQEQTMIEQELGSLVAREQLASGSRSSSRLDQPLGSSGTFQSQGRDLVNVSEGTRATFIDLAKERARSKVRSGLNLDRLTGSKPSGKNCLRQPNARTLKPPICLPGTWFNVSRVPR
jgi:hypothetical protein